MDAAPQLPTLWVTLPSQ